MSYLSLLLDEVPRKSLLFVSIEAYKNDPLSALQNNIHPFLGVRADVTPEHAKLVLRNELLDVTDRFPLRSRTRRTLQTKTARYESRFHRLTRSAAGFS